MLDELREEEIVRKVGGRFKLSTLIQKRMVALHAGARPLVNLNTNDKMKIVLREIIEDKIFLDTDNTVRIGKRPQAAGGPPELDLSAL